MPGQGARSSNRRHNKGLVGFACAIVVAGTLTGAQAALAQGASAKPTVEQRLARIERLLKSSAIIELMNRLEKLQAEVRAMRGDLEIATHDLDGIKQRQRDLFVDIDELPRRIDSNAAGTPPSDGGQIASAAPATVGGDATRGTEGQGATVAPATNVEATPTGTPERDGAAARAAPAQSSGTAAVATSSPSSGSAPASGSDALLAEQNAYRDAFALVREGRYSKAAIAFRKFLESYGGGRYADNAHYWLGEVYYADRKYDQALESFQALIARFPDSPKRLGAQLKIGFAQHELGKTEAAVTVLKKLAAENPQSAEARLAQDRLSRIERERNG
jgi:tol-pal system protein YbgF